MRALDSGVRPGVGHIDVAPLDGGGAWVTVQLHGTVEVGGRRFTSTVEERSRVAVPVLLGVELGADDQVVRVLDLAEIAGCPLRFASSSMLEGGELLLSGTCTDSTVFAQRSQPGSPPSWRWVVEGEDIFASFSLGPDRWANGDVLVEGAYFGDEVVFPGQSAWRARSLRSFLARMDPRDGSLVWAREIPARIGQSIQNAIILPDGSVVLSAFFTPRRTDPSTLNVPTRSSLAVLSPEGELLREARFEGQLCRGKLHRFENGIVACVVTNSEPPFRNAVWGWDPTTGQIAWQRPLPGEYSGGDSGVRHLGGSGSEAWVLFTEDNLDLQVSSENHVYSARLRLVGVSSTGTLLGQRELRVPGTAFERYDPLVVVDRDALRYYGVATDVSRSLATHEGLHFASYPLPPLTEISP